MRKIDRLDERCLGIIYNDKQSSFQDLLEKDSSVCIYERKVKILATEIYKVSENFSSSHTNEIFEVRNKHPLQSKTKLSFPGL